MPNKKASLKTLKRLFENPGMDYYELMESHRYDLSWAGRRFPTQEIKGVIKEIKRRALIETAKKLNGEESVYDKDIRKNHSGLLDASRTVYDSLNGRSAWQRILSDAGVSYTPFYRKWTLKYLIDRLNSFGDDPKDFSHFKVYKKDSYIPRFSSKKLGQYGKAVMLVGIDFLSMLGVRNRKYSFTKEDFYNIVYDKDLDNHEKARCIFYGISLQYYNFKKYRSSVRREFDSDVREYNRSCPTRYGSFISLYMVINKNLTDFRTRIELDYRIPARFHRTDFCFQGVRSSIDSRSFKENLEDILSKSLL